jgi:hypothetical protein
LDVLNNDFQNVLVNIQTLIDAVSRPGRVKKGVLVHESDGSSKIKIRHVLFEVRILIFISSPFLTLTLIQKRKEGESVKPKNLPLNLTISCWHTNSEEARLALEDIKMTHHVRPLHVYNTMGTRVDPKDYRDVLQGAIVRVHFTLSHWAITDKKDNKATGMDSFTADVANIHVLRPPPPLPYDNKREYLAVDPFAPDLGPSKKKRAISSNDK